MVPAENDLQKEAQLEVDGPGSGVAEEPRRTVEDDDIGPPPLLSRKRFRCELVPYCTSTYTKQKDEYGLLEPDEKGLNMGALEPGGSKFLTQLVFDNWSRYAVHYVHGHRDLFDATIGVIVNNKDYDANRVVFANKRGDHPWRDPWHVGANSSFQLYIECPQIREPHRLNLPEWIAIGDTVFRTPENGWNRIGFPSKTGHRCRFVWRQCLNYTEDQTGDLWEFGQDLETGESLKWEVVNLQITAIWRLRWGLFSCSPPSDTGREFLMLHTAFLTHVGKGDPCAGQEEQFRDTGAPEDPDYRLMWEGTSFKAMPSWRQVYGDRSHNDQWWVNYRDSFCDLKPKDEYEDVYQWKRKPRNGQPVNGRVLDRWFRLQIYKIASGDGNYRKHHQALYGRPILETLVAVSFPSPENPAGQPTHWESVGPVEGQGTVGPLELEYLCGGGRNTFTDVARGCGGAEQELSDTPKKIVVTTDFRGSHCAFWPEQSTCKEFWPWPPEGAGAPILSHYVPPYGQWVLGMDGPWGPDQCGGEMKDVIAGARFMFHMARERGFDVAKEPPLDDADLWDGVLSYRDRETIVVPHIPATPETHEVGAARMCGGSHGTINGIYVLSKINGESTSSSYNENPREPGMHFTSAWFIAGLPYFLLQHVYFCVYPPETGLDPLLPDMAKPEHLALPARFCKRWSISEMDIHGQRIGEMIVFPEQDGACRVHQYIPRPKDVADHLRVCAEFEHAWFERIGHLKGDGRLDDGSEYHDVIHNKAAWWYRLGFVAAVTHLSELGWDPELGVNLNFYDNHGDLIHKFNGPPRGMDTLYFTQVVQDLATSQESMLLYVSKFWGMMNDVNDNGSIREGGVQRMFLEQGTQLQYVLAHDSVDHTAQNWALWLLVLANQVHNVTNLYSQDGMKSWMFTQKVTEKLRADSTWATWDPYSPDGNTEWEAHKLLHSKAVEEDFRKYNKNPRDHDDVRITVCQTVESIEVKARIHHWDPMQVKRWQTISQELYTCRVRLYSRAGNRTWETHPITGEKVRVPLWLREGRAYFGVPSTRFKIGAGLTGPASDVTVVLSDVPVGWAVLEIWSEIEENKPTTPVKTMNVHVTPKIRVRPRGNGGWGLVSEGEVGADIQTIEGAIWKRDDLYYTDEDGNDLDPPELRYDRNEIKGYRTRQNAEFSVDEHEIDVLDDGKVYCGPDRATSPCNDLPRHASERIGMIELELQRPLRRKQLTDSIEDQPPSAVIDHQKMKWSGKC